MSQPEAKQARPQFGLSRALGVVVRWALASALVIAVHHGWRDYADEVHARQGRMRCHSGDLSLRQKLPPAALLGALLGVLGAARRYSRRSTLVGRAPGTLVRPPP